MSMVKVTAVVISQYTAVVDSTLLGIDVGQASPHDGTAGVDPNFLLQNGAAPSARQMSDVQRAKRIVQRRQYV
jgi:hypothetical protein